MRRDRNKIDKEQLEQARREKMRSGDEEKMRNRRE